MMFSYFHNYMISNYTTQNRVLWKPFDAFCLSIIKKSIQRTYVLYTWMKEVR